MGARSSLGKYPRKISQEILVEEWRNVTGKGRKRTKRELMVRLPL